MGRYRGGRTTVYAGWTLYNHFEAMASRMFAYKPPVSFQAMTQTPPPYRPIGGSKIDTQLVFPDDKLRREVEKHSEHARRLAREGLTISSGQWYTRRPIDDAIARIKNIMREKQLNTRDAIMEWDREYDLELKLQEQEKKLLAEEARNSGAAISVAEGMNILKMLRDLQTEALLLKKKKMDRVIERIQEEKQSSRQAMSGQESLLADMTEKMSLSKLRNDMDFDNELKNEKEDITVEFDRLIDLEKLQYRYKRFEKILSETQLRKIAEAKMIEQLVIQIRDIKEEFSNDDTFSSGDQISPLDLLSVFVKAYDVNKIPATSAEWGKERAMYSSAFIGGKRAYDVLKEKNDLFRKRYRRFSRMATIDVDVSHVMKTVHEDQASAARGGALVHPEATLAEFRQFDYAPIISELKQFNWIGHYKLEENVAVLNELVALLDLSYYLDDAVINRKQPMFLSSPDALQ